MKSVFYVEDDFVAGLLKQYFVGTGNHTVFCKVGITSKRIRADLFLAQSEDVPTNFPRSWRASAGKAARSHPRPHITIRTNSLKNINRSRTSFRLPELLESNLRWHIRLARTMRIVEEVKAHFDGAESVLILLQDDPDPDAIASGLALRQVLGRNKQTTPLGSFGRVTRPENIAMVKLLEIEIEKITKDHDQEIRPYRRCRSAAAAPC